MKAAPRLRRGKRSFSPRTWSGWIPVTSTGMRDRGCAAPTTFACEYARDSNLSRNETPRGTAPSPPSSLCLSQGSSSVASAARKSFSSPRTWPGWIPVTSTGMRDRDVRLLQLSLANVRGKRQPVTPISFTPGTSPAFGRAAPRALTPAFRSVSSRPWGAPRRRGRRRRYSRRTEW
jgi:hypothetical protein